MIGGDMEIEEKIKSCKSIPELDALRLDVVKSMQDDGGSRFYDLQSIFIKQKNKLLRIPLSKRTW